MKKYLSVLLLLVITQAHSGWWDDTKDKAKELGSTAKEKTISAYQSSKEYIEENKDGWWDKTKEYYNKAKDSVSDTINKD